MPWLGYVVSIVFYLLLVLAALTSIISMHETPTAFVSEEFGMNRKSAARLVTFFAMITGALCSLSLGAVPQLQLFGKSLFDFFDFLSANILLTAGGFFTCIYVGWVMPKQTIIDEITNGGTLRVSLLKVLMILVKFVCPIAIFIIFLHQFNLI